ncbi:MAG: UDP-N-acetylmuramoyl-L-alanine--D-glutamate ligase, partial [Lachnospiraceae bacterium]|nr:UDP-N-acetylmuramoyl-L-alanine--D-glutamate ligase [Lachnospiraceae bacterium]
MDKVLKQIISNKNILILGFGREGKSTLREILALGGFLSVTIADAKDIPSEIKKDLPDYMEYVTGDGYLDCIDDYDVVFKSPGVVLKKPASEYKALITAQMDIFLMAYRDRSIGITGTKGKSTTSSLIAHLLKENGKNVLFAGNIGIPVFDIWKQVEDDSVVVIEMSCHQLEYIRVSPRISVLLNIYEDHLDHYETREKYAEAK